MSDLDKSKMQQQRLTVERMTGLLWALLSIVLFLTAIGISQLFVRHFLLAAGALVAAAALVLIVLSFWNQVRTVKAETAVHTALPRSEFQMPQIVSLIIVLFVTAFVSMCSAFILYVVNLNCRTQLGWTVCGATLLAVWLFVTYCWYRVLTEKPLTTSQFQEQTEGVWPPALVMTTKRDNL